MTRPTSALPSVTVVSVDAAMARVLAAEQQARLAIEAAQAQALQLAEDGRTAQRMLAERSRRRSLRVREAFSRYVGARLEALAAEVQALAGPPGAGTDSSSQVDLAVARLAADLTEPARTTGQRSTESTEPAISLTPDQHRSVAAGAGP